VGGRIGSERGGLAAPSRRRREADGDLEADEVGTKDERRKTNAFKFEKLEVWQLALDYIDLIYEIAEQLPRSEAYNLILQETEIRV